MNFSTEKPKVDVIHFVGASGDDRTLCGMPLEGNEDNGFQRAAGTHAKVNCPDCIFIVHHCALIEREEYE